MVLDIFRDNVQVCGRMLIKEAGHVFWLIKVWDFYPGRLLQPGSPLYKKR